MDLKQIKDSCMEYKGRLYEWLILLFLSLLAGWSLIAELDQVVTAIGVVVPQGQVKVVQHLEGGIIRKIHVVDGDQVQHGDPLIDLDLASGGINKNELQVRLDALLLTRERLHSEASRQQPNFSEEMRLRYPQLVESEMRTYSRRTSELESSLDVLNKQMSFRKQKVTEIEKKLEVHRKNLELARKQLEITEEIFRENLTSELVLLEKRILVEQLSGDIEVEQEEMVTATAYLSEIYSREHELQLTFQREAEEEGNRVEREIASLQEQLAEAVEQQKRAQLFSPIEGVIQNLKYTTVGGIIHPGEPIMEVIPSTDSLVVEAKLSPMDRGMVQVGQQVSVKISAYDFIRYGTLDGEVLQIAADTDMDEEMGSYYRMEIATEHPYLGDEETRRYSISSGMEAEIDVHTGEQTVFDYLIRPVLKMKHDSFREP